MIRILASLLLALSFSSVSLAYSHGWIEGEQASVAWDIFNTAKFLNKAAPKGVMLIAKVKKNAECEYKEVSGYQKNELSCGGGLVKIEGLKAEQLKNSFQVAGLLEYTGSKVVSNGRVTFLTLRWSSCEFGSVNDKKEDQYLDCR